MTAAQDLHVLCTQTPKVGLTIRVGVVYAGAAAIWLLIVFLNTAVFEGADSLAVRLLNAAVVCILGVSLVVVARRHLDRRPFEGLGLTITRKAWVFFGVGVMAFALPSVAGLCIAAFTGWVRISLVGSSADLLFSIVVLLVTVFCYEAFPEELIFRGYLYRNLSAVTPPWLAAVGQALLFAIFGTALWVLTNGWGVLIERGSIFFCMAIVLGFIRIASGSVWTCVGFHWSFQIAAQTILGPRVDASGPVELVSIVFAFVLGTAIVSLSLRRQANWTQPQPDPKPLSSKSPMTGTE